MRIKKTNESEPLMKYRKVEDDIETGGTPHSRDKSGRNPELLTRRCPVLRWRDLDLGACTELGNLSFCDSGLASAEIRMQQTKAGNVQVKQHENKSTAEMNPSRAQGRSNP